MVGIALALFHASLQHISMLNILHLFTSTRRHAGLRLGRGGARSACVSDVTVRVGLARALPVPLVFLLERLLDELVLEYAAHLSIAAGLSSGWQRGLDSQCVDFLRMQVILRLAILNRPLAPLIKMDPVITDSFSEDTEMEFKRVTLLTCWSMTACYCPTLPPCTSCPLLP